MRKTDLSRKAKNLKEVNREIHRIFPTVNLVRGNGYFYIASDDDEMGLKIAGLFTTSIPVCYLHEQTIEQWVKDVKYLMADPDGERATSMNTND